jgi:hypothetical protein
VILLILLHTKFDGDVGIFFETPKIFAPKYLRQRDSQEPLKPV